jgi:uncharacterized protein YbaP (TraB family)
MLRLRAVIAALIFTALPAVATAAPAMWEVSDGDSRVWLFGSMHLLPAGTEWRTPLFDATVAKAEKVYFEADVGPWGILGATIWMLKSGFNNAQHPWLSTLTPEQTQKLTTAIAPLGMTLKDLAAFDPWLAGLVIEQKALDAPAGGASASTKPSVSGPDMAVEGELVPERKAYFETVAQQLNLMSALPREQQIASLMATLDDLGGTSGDLDTMAAKWSSGDVDALQTAITQDPDTGGPLADTMIYGRNRNWVPVIEGMLAQNHQDLVIVGAAHLIGDGSVTDLLSKAGFTVTRIQ